jgi:hypothetical protein
MPPDEALDALGLIRSCCRTTIVTHVNVMQAALDFDYVNSIRPPDDGSHERIKVYRAGGGDGEGATNGGEGTPRKKRVIYAW